MSAEPGWTRHWSNERHIPDYSRVQERLESLLASGHADEVVALGDEILRRGIQQIEMSNDEGETGQEIAGCMEIVLRALNASSKTVPERWLWEIDVRLRDNYGMLDGIEGPLSDQSATKPADWSAVADTLARRLEAIPSATDPKREADDGSRDHHRRRIVRWLLDALQRAGRDHEITAILTREAGITQCYVELVDHLLAAGQEEAAEWARKGFERTIEKSPGTAWSLAERLRDLAARRRDRPQVAAFRAMEFFHRPDADRYTEVQKATAPLGLWDTVRPMLLRWLETGSRPDRTPAEAPPRRGRTRGVPPATTGQSAWPLPSTGLLVPDGKGRYLSFPDTATLIAIAIREKRNDDVLRWYELAGNRGGDWPDPRGETVAEAVRETHPDRALALWLRSAQAHIAQKKPAAYQMAGARLSKMKAIYQRAGRLPEWDRLLADLRVENARKPRMIEVLDGLEGKRSRILKP